MLNNRARPRSAFLPALLSLGLILLAGGLGGVRAVRLIRAYAAYPPDFDEAVHLLPALQLAHDLRALRLADFARHTYSQDKIALYPFLHSWLTAPFFLVWKPDLVVARASGLAYLSAAAVVAFFAARKIAARERWPWLAGLTAALLTLASLPLWVYASTALLEAAGLLVTFVWLACYVQADSETGRPLWLMGASLAAAAALFTKYSYGLFVVGGMALSEVLGVLAEKRWPDWRRGLYLAGPFALAALVWFAGEGKLSRFWVYSHSQNAEVELWSAANLLYYPASLARHYVSGPAALALILAGAALGIWEWRQHRFRAVTAYLLVGLAMLTLVPQNEIRFLYTVGPAAFLLAGAAAARAATWLGELWGRGSRLRPVLILLCVGLLAVEARAVAHRFSFFDAALETAYLSSPDTRAAYRFVIDQSLAQGARPHLVGFWHLFSHYALEWEYYLDAGGEPAEHDYQLVTASPAPEPTPENLGAWPQALRDQSITMIVSVDGSPAGSITGWQVMEPLWARGVVERVAASPPYTLVEWPDIYVARVLAGDFSGPEALAAARRESRTEFTIQLYLYALVGP